MDKVTSNGKKLACLECGNDLTVAPTLKQGDYFECEFCGIEYEVSELTPEGEIVAKIVEEEK